MLVRSRGVRRSLSVIAAILASAPPLISQVTIRERVEITPKPPKQFPMEAASGGSITVSFSWSGSFKNRPKSMVVKNACGDNAFTDQPGTLSIPAKSGGTDAIVRWSGGPGVATLTFTAGGGVLRSDMLVSTCDSCTYQMNPTVFLESGVKLTMPNLITHGESVSITMTKKSFSVCSVAFWHPNMNITLTITENADLGGFCNANDSLLGTSVTGTLAQLNGIHYCANGNQPPGGKATVRMQAQIDGQNVGEGIIEVEGTSSPPVIDSVRTSTGKLQFPVGSTVTFEGYFHDVDNDVISAEWTKVAGPIVATISSKGSISPQMSSVASTISSPARTPFVLDQEGTYVFRFSVSDGINPAVVADLPVQAIGLDHFEVTLEKDTIAFTESSKIFVQGKDKDNNNWDIDGTTKLTFSLAGESAYGTFIEPKGDTVKTAQPLVEDVAYSDAKAGKVVFAALAANPETRGSPKIVVSLQSDVSKEGHKEIVVLEQHLKILMDSPLRVQPRLSNGSGGLQLLPGNRKNLAVRLTRGGVLKGNHSFTLSSDYVNLTGGHDHPQRRSENHDNYGYFRSYQDNREARPITEMTRSNVMSAFEYVSSAFGDSMKLRVTSNSLPTLLKDSVSIAEMIDDLQLLGETDSYIKVGGTCNHHGPRTDNQDVGCRVPDNNHWIVAEAADSLRSGAEAFLEAAWNINRETIRINDVSLPHGGLFDINGTWLSPHDSHRTGKDVDIENISRLSQLRSVLERRRWIYIVEGPTFFPHFRFE